MDRDPARDRFEIADSPPEEAWRELAANRRSCLVDVRTKPEWMYVGVPDLSPIGRRVIFTEWNIYPDMRINACFAAELRAGLGSEWPETIFFLCRSGVRSKAAAAAFSGTAAAIGSPVRCVNVAEGFEGDLDGSFRRGRANGWKVKKLPWRQS